jgi:hypothetical protein
MKSELFGENVKVFTIMESRPGDLDSREDLSARF